MEHGRLWLAAFLAMTNVAVGFGPNKAPAGDDVMHRPVTGTFSKAAPASAEIRLASWNIDRGYHVDRIVNTLSEKRPEICLLQEVDYHTRRTQNRNVAKDIAERLGYNYAFGAEFQELSQSVDKEPAYHGQATLSRWPIVRTRMIRFERQSGWWKPHSAIPNVPFFQRRLGGRIALVTEIETGNARLVVYNLHLESRSGGAIQDAQLDEVLRDLAKYPPGTGAILGGDFNSKYHPFRLLHRLERQGFRSVLGRKVERTHVLIGYLDWIFYRGPWVTENAGVVRGTHASDHDLIVANLSRSPLAKTK